MSAAAGAACAGEPLFSSLTKRIILHIDMDCFYAQVEHMRMGIPREEPLAVQQWDGLIAVNYAARARGITRHMRVAEAKAKCPELHCVHVEVIYGDQAEAAERGDGAAPGSAHGSSEERHPDRSEGKVSLERYRRASSDVFDALAPFGLVEKASIDEAYLDVTQRVQEMRRNLSLASEAAGEEFLGWPTPESSNSAVYGEIDMANENDLRLLLGAQICQMARAAVQAQTNFTCSGGISHNKMLSKLASARNKPNRQTIVPVTGVQALLEQLPLKSIRGLGGKLGGEACELLKLGEDPRASDVQRFTLQQLQVALGDKTGPWLHQVVRGVDEEPVKERDKAKSCLAFKSFSPVPNLSALEKWVCMLSSELAERIIFEKRQRNRQPRQFLMQYRGRGGAGGSRSCPLPHACSADGGKEVSAIASALQTLTRTLLQPLPDLFPCTRVAIGVTNFVEPVTGGGISSFFAKAPPPGATNAAPAAIDDSEVGDAAGLGQGERERGVREREERERRGRERGERERGERERERERERARARKRHGHGSGSISSFFSAQPPAASADKSPSPLNLREQPRGRGDGAGEWARTGGGGGGDRGGRGGGGGDGPGGASHVSGAVADVVFEESVRQLVEMGLAHAHAARY
jgi:DNA polymerase eta